jgi:hypothetical protein
VLAVVLAVYSEAMTATSSPIEVGHRPPPATPARRAVGAVRIAASVLIISAIATQVIDLVSHHAFVAGEYFAYFTIESSLMNIVVLAVGGVLALRWRTDPALFATVRLAIVAYATVTGVVYNGLLRGVESTGYVGVQWPNEVMHVVIPILIVLDWFVAPGRARLPFSRLGAVVVYPIVWAVATLVRGAVTVWYPYPFLDPAHGGYGSVVLYIVGIAAFIVAVALMALARHWPSAVPTR